MNVNTDTAQQTTQQVPAIQTETRPPAIAFTARDEFELALRQAKVYAASTIVPEAYRDNLPNCLIALNMAKRIGMDPLQTMQQLYIVHGRPGWSGQSMIAMFNQCGRFTALRFEWKGAEGSKDRGCRAYAVEKSTNQRVEGPWITWQMVEAEAWASKAGSKWKTIPELMFMYRAAAWLVRTHAPEIAMGLQTVEEIEDVIDVTPTQETPPANAIDAAKQAIAATMEKQTAAPSNVDPQTGELLPAA